MTLDRARLASAMSAAVAERLILYAPPPVMERHQRQPDGSWLGWLMLAGRGSGKTAAMAKATVEHVRGPRCLPGPEPHHIGIVGPTKDDAVTCYTSEIGIRRHDPSARMVVATGGTQIRWPNGSRAMLHGTNTQKDVDHLRAHGNRCWDWYEELAAWPMLQDGFDQAQFGLRSGPHPRWVGSTTPKPRALIKRLHDGALPGVVVTHATMRDNPHLPPHIRAKLLTDYSGTVLAEQEIEGKIVDQVVGALWQRAQIAKYRLTAEQAPIEMCRRVVVGVDPSGGADWIGIVVVGVTTSALPHPEHEAVTARGLVLGDYSCILDPDGWGDRAVQAAIDHDADLITFESDYGRDMPKSVLVNAAERAGIAIAIKPSRAGAIGNKRARAFPVAQLAAQGRYPHVGVHEDLEDELCTWTDAPHTSSPNRMDAMVWPAWATGLVHITMTTAASIPGAGQGSRSLTGR